MADLNTPFVDESLEPIDGIKGDIPDKHCRATHTDDMQRCTHLIRGTKICKNRSSADSTVCQYHEPSRLAKERALSLLKKRSRLVTEEIAEDGIQKHLKGIDEEQDDITESAIVKKDITRISGSQNRMYNPLATPLVELGCVGLPLSTNWGDCFKNPDLPVHLDIGSARGKFLIDLAEMHNSKNFIGIEIRNKLVEEANEILKTSKSRGNGNDNCVFFCANLLRESHQVLLEERLVPLNITRISILFPDPWIKKKHQDRRVVQVPMVKSLSKILKKGGELIIASDVESVILDARNKMAECSDFFEFIILNSPANMMKFTEELENSSDVVLSSINCEREEKVNKIEISPDTVTDTNGLNNNSEMGSINDETPSNFDFDDNGYLLSNPFKPLASEREQVCEMSWRKVFRLLYIRK